jgi:hypothetical protein
MFGQLLLRLVLGSSTLFFFAVRAPTIWSEGEDEIIGSRFAFLLSPWRSSFFTEPPAHNSWKRTPRFPSDALAGQQLWKWF